MLNSFKAIKIINLALLILISTANKNKKFNELGDTDISVNSKQGIFGDLDNDNNGNISIEELRDYIVDTGGIGLDEQAEIQNAVDNVLLAIDNNEDKVLNIDDLSQYWTTLASILPSEEVSAWAEHSQQLPQHIVTKFIENSISGYDFPELLANDGALLESDLGIDKVAMKRRIMRGMRMKLLGMSKSPYPPRHVKIRPLSCSKILIEWDNHDHQKVLDFPVHKYIIQRLHSLENKNVNFEWIYSSLNYIFNNKTPTNNDQPSTQSSVKLNWLTVFDGIETIYEDNNLEKEVNYQYRIVAWNAVGHSEYVYFSCSTIVSPCTYSQSYFSTIIYYGYIVFYSCLQYVLPILMALLTFSRALGKRNSLSPVMLYVCDMSKSILDFISYYTPLSINQLSNETANINRSMVRVNSNNSGLSDESNNHFSHHDNFQARSRTSSDDNLKELELDLKICYICKQKFKFFMNRQRHNCNICSKPFCKNCGKTSHNDILQCKVPSECTCKECIILKNKFKNNLKQVIENEPNSKGISNSLLGIAFQSFKRAGRYSFSSRKSSISSYSVTSSDKSLEIDGLNKINSSGKPPLRASSY